MNAPAEISRLLREEGFPPTTQTWVQSIITGKSLRDLPALVAEVKARLLAADWTTPGLVDGSSPSVFPAQLLRSGAESIQQHRLARDIAVQVLDVENMSQSRWQQVQALEAIERGEQKRGREIIRVVSDVDAEVTDSPSGSAGGPPRGGGGPAARTQAPPDTHATHRLVLQDTAGSKMFAIELVRIPRIGIGRLRIGEKLMLKAGTTVTRGMVLLDPTSVVFLGGQIEAMNSAWLKGRLARLREAAVAETSS